MMEATYKTDDELEMKRISKSLDMALCLWNISSIKWFDYDDETLTAEIVNERIQEFFNRYSIDVNDLVQ